MADRTTDDGHSGPSGSARQGTHLLAQQKLRPESLRDFLDEWAEEDGPPDPEDVATMRRRYFPQRFSTSKPENSPHSPLI